jgi:PAS domain S-box-containing protein
MYKTIIKHIPQKIFVKNRNSVYISCNENFAADLKVKPEDIVGKTDFDLYPREVAERYRSEDRRIMEEGNTEELEGNYIEDGKEVFVHMVKTPLKDEQGNINGILGIILDITEKKRTEIILEESRQNLENMVAHLNWQLGVNEALAELYKPLTSPEVSIKQITNVILARGKRLTGSQHGYVSYIDQVTGDLIGYTLTEMMKDECDVEEKEKSIVFPIGADGRYPGLWGHSLNTRQGFYTNAPGTHPSASGPPGGHVPLEAFLSQPVMLGDRLVGQIGLANPGRDYTNRDLEAVQRLGEFYALAIQRFHVQQILRESERKFRATFEQAAVGIAHVALDGRWLRVNQKLCAVVGYSKEDLLERTFQDITHPDDLEQDLAYVRQMLAGEIEAYTMEKRYIRKDRSMVPVNLTVALVHDAAGEPQYFISVVEDISERKQMEKELADHREHLEELVKDRTAELSAAHERLRQAQKMEAIGTLAGGIAHDFNNVLGAIIGYTELAMLDIPDNTTPKDNLEEVLKAALRAKEMVRQILTFSRKTREEKKWIFLNEIVEEAVKFLRSSIPAFIEIEVALENNPSPLLADPTQIHQVIMNICANAVHAMKEEGGVLKIELSEISYYHGGSNIHGLAPGNYQHLAVSDTGHGMTPDILERIFEPYFTSKKVGEGTGMGLAVVHGIIKSHKGEITVDSKPGKGTTFHVFLPVFAQEKTLDEQYEKKQQKNEFATPFPGQRGSERILFVDDEQMLVKMGERMLKKLGYRVTAFSSSTGALELFRKQSDQFDLLILDMTMPQVTGLQLAKKCREIRADIPVILCTGFSENISEENFRSQGIDGFVMKPMKMDEIAAVIRDVFRDSH